VPEISVCVVNRSEQFAKRASFVDRVGALKRRTQALEIAFGKESHRNDIFLFHDLDCFRNFALNL